MFFIRRFKYDGSIYFINIYSEKDWNYIYFSLQIAYIYILININIANRSKFFSVSKREYMYAVLQLSITYNIYYS